MSTVVIEPELAAQLTGNGDEVSLADRDGKLLGHLVKPEDYEAFKAWRQAALDRLYKEPTLEEFRQSLANNKRWYTTEEIFKLLEE
jgi:hypothetical protein